MRLTLFRLHRILVALSIAAAIVSLFARQGSAADAPPLSGTLAYLHDGAVYVGAAASQAAAAQIVPRSKGAISFSLSSTGDGTIVFFADKPHARGIVGGSGGPPLCAYYSRPPYKDSEALPIYLGKDDDINVSWDATGDAEISIGDLQTRRLDVKTGKMTVVRDPSNKANGRRRRGGSGVGGGDISVYTDGDNRILLTRTPGGPETVLFNAKSPDSMFAAIKRAKNPVNLKQLTDAIDAALWKDPRNWSISSPALTSDKRSAFIASNLGTSMGARGNTFFCLFAIDTTTSNLAVLSKAGTFFGRVPTDMSVSPDDNRLFLTSSAHSSAADNSFSGYVIDLQTQQTREIIRSDPAHPSDANLTGGWCWSPDGRYLALAVLYYNIKSVNDDHEPNLNDSTLYIKDAATGRIVEQIPHAQMPAWAK